VSSALAFMRDIGAAFSPDAPPDPDRMREIYARHASRLLPRHPRSFFTGTVHLIEVPHDSGITATGRAGWFAPAR
jgi:hypothetical protein